MDNPLYYANLFEYTGPGGSYQFKDNWYMTRQNLEYAAREELRIEPRTRRIAIIRLMKIKPS